jgi:hypothetical protein
MVIFGSSRAVVVYDSNKLCVLHSAPATRTRLSIIRLPSQLELPQASSQCRREFLEDDEILILVRRICCEYRVFFFCLFFVIVNSIQFIVD